MKNPKKLNLFLIAITSLTFLSWLNPTSFQHGNTWSVSIGGNRMFTQSNTKPGDVVELKRDALKLNDTMVVRMYFDEESSANAQCMVIINNEDGKLLRGPVKSDNEMECKAFITVQEILSNNDFKNSQMLNIMFDIKNAENKNLNHLYILVRIKLV